LFSVTIGGQNVDFFLCGHKSALSSELMIATPSISATGKVKSGSGFGLVAHPVRAAIRMRIVGFIGPPPSRQQKPG